MFPTFAPPRWRGQLPASGRRRQRVRRGELARSWAEVAFGVGSWHALGRPDRCPGTLPALDARLRATAWARCVERSAAMIRSATVCDVAGGGRRSQSLLREARDQEAALVEVSLEQNAYDRAVPTAVRAAGHGGGPKRIEAAKLSLPAVGCTWDITPHLAGETLAGFVDPRTLAVPPSMNAIKPRVNGSDREVLAMYRRFDDAGMLYLANPAEVPRGRGGAPATSGFFVVPKSEEADRTVQDRRVPNAGERRLKDACTRLPHGSCYTELQLEPGETVRGHADDLPDCFHSVRCSDRRAASNAIGEPRRLGDLSETRAAAEYREKRPDATDGDLVYACNRALAMGDGNAVEFVQSAHVASLRKHGAARPEELVAYREPVPRGPVWESVMIDDHTVIARVPRGSVREAGDRDTELLEQADAAYAADKLTPKPSKRVRDAEDFQSLGAAVSGSQRFVSASIPSLVNTLAFSGWVLEHGVATKALWEGLVGLWVNILLYARTGFALTGRIYSEAKDADTATLFRPSLRSLDEMRTLCALAPLLGTDIGAPVEPCLSAVDASSRSAAVVSTPIGGHAARELWRHRARRGTTRGALGPGTTVEEKLRSSVFSEEREIADAVDAITGDCYDNDDDDDLPHAAPTWVAELADGTGWALDVKYRLPASEHINLKEARPLRTVVRAALARCVDGPRRHLALSDSSVNVGAWARGRSPSPRLNAFLRDSAPERLALGLQLGVIKVETEFNPADDPTRGRPVRGAPRGRAPAWLAALQRGEYALFDAELANDREARRLRALPLGQLLDEAGARQWRKVRRTAPLGALRRYVAHVLQTAPGAQAFGKEYSSDNEGDGPRQPADLAATRVSADERRRRDRALAVLDEWLRPGTTVPALLEGSARIIGAVLAEFGQHLYDDGGRLYVYRSAILGAQDARRDLGTLRQAWDIVTSWEQLEPGQNHLPLPLPYLAALVSAACLWGWWDFALALVTGFDCMARPGELLAAERRNLVLEDDLPGGLAARTAFFIVEKPKTRRTAARQQHVRIRRGDVIDALTRRYGALPRAARLWPYSPYQFRQRWDRCCDALGLPHVDGTGFTPASLRAGGASFLYAETDRVDVVHWRGRWVGERSVESYVQELPALMAQARAAPGRAGLIHSLAAVTGVLLRRCPTRGAADLAF